MNVRLSIFIVFLMLLMVVNNADYFGYTVKKTFNIFTMITFVALAIERFYKHQKKDKTA
jgi:hypothetical protein